jgi:spindle assembly abnormal protein 6
MSSTTTRSQQICLNNSEHAYRFQAVLLAVDATSVFKIVETNDFNQLPHITLAFRPGNDATIKRFLASRLSEVKLTNGKLSSDLHQVQVIRYSFSQSTYHGMLHILP